MITIELTDYAKEVANYKYAYAFIATEMTNSTDLALGVDLFNDFDELATERGMDEDEIEEIKDMACGQSIYNDNYWTIVRIK